MTWRRAAHSRKPSTASSATNGVDADRRGTVGAAEVDVLRAAADPQIQRARQRERPADERPGGDAEPIGAGELLADGDHPDVGRDVEAVAARAREPGRAEPHAEPADSRRRRRTTAGSTCRTRTPRPPRRAGARSGARRRGRSPTGRRRAGAAAAGPRPGWRRPRAPRRRWWGRPATAGTMRRACGFIARPAAGCRAPATGRSARSGRSPRTRP